MRNFLGHCKAQDFTENERESLWRVWVWERCERTSPWWRITYHTQPHFLLPADFAFLSALNPLLPILVGGFLLIFQGSHLGGTSSKIPWSHLTPRLGLGAPRMPSCAEWLSPQGVFCAIHEITYVKVILIYKVSFKHISCFSPFLFVLPFFLIFSLLSPYLVEVLHLRASGRVGSISCVWVYVYVPRGRIQSVHQCLRSTWPKKG